MVFRHACFSRTRETDILYVGSKVSLSVNHDVQTWRGYWVLYRVCGLHCVRSIQYLNRPIAALATAGPTGKEGRKPQVQNNTFHSK